MNLKLNSSGDDISFRAEASGSLEEKKLNDSHNLFFFKI